MGFQFFNNWPYSDTYFPSMDDHIDPVNNEYFTGLHTEIERIEYYLGENPQGSFLDLTERLSGFDFSTDYNYDALTSRIDQEVSDINATLGPDVQRGYSHVRDKLEFHDHSGGYAGASILPSIPTLWEDTNFYATPIPYNPGSGLGGCYCGFAYYDNAYLGPAMADSGNNMIIMFNEPTNSFSDHVLSQYTAEAYGSARIGNTMYAGCQGAPGKVLKLVIPTWTETLITLNSGEDQPRHMIYFGGYIYFVCYTSPGKLIKFNPGDDTWSTYDFASGENEPIAICTDGTYIYTCTNTVPVKLIRYDPSGPSHTAFIIQDLNAPVWKMIKQGDFIYMFSTNADTQVCKLELSTGRASVLGKVWPTHVYSAAWWDPYIVVGIRDGSETRFVLWNPVSGISFISLNLGNIGEPYWITLIGNYALWPNFDQPRYDMAILLTYIS